MQFQTPTGPVAVTVPDAVTLWAAVRARLRAGEGFALATLNLDHLDKLRRDRAFAAAYAAQDLVTADGNPVVWLSRLGGRPVMLLPGADLVEPLAQIAVAEGRGVAFLGSTRAALHRSLPSAAQRSRPAVVGRTKYAPFTAPDPPTRRPRSRSVVGVPCPPSSVSATTRASSAVGSRAAASTTSAFSFSSEPPLRTINCFMIPT